MFKSVYENFFADFLRTYKVLPRRLQAAALRVFSFVVVMAILEVCTILSISFLAVSVASPEKLQEFGPVKALFRLIPQLSALCEDPRLFALLVSVAVVSLTTAKNAMSAFVNHRTARLGENIALFAGETVFRHYLYTPYIGHLAGDSNVMFQALSWRRQLSQMVIDLMMVYTYAAVTLAMIITLLSATPGTIVLVILLVGLSSAALYKTLKSGIDRAGCESAEWSRKETKSTMNAMNGIREILIYRQQGVFFDVFQQACLGGLKDRIFLTIAPPIPTWTLETVGFLVIPITLWAMYALQDASMARITGVLTMIMLISWRVLPLLNRSLSALVSVRAGRHAAMDCLAQVKEALTNPAPVPPLPDPGFVLTKSITFQDVCFRYPKAEQLCLHHLTFSIPCGGRVGIIGRSGAGKSSIAAILSGLVKPTSGEVLIDGGQLTPSGLAAYCQRVGYVPQAPYILSGSLAENVAFSQWGKPWDEEKVKKVCRMAELDVAETHGVNFLIGSSGGGLSGGQAQRLSIARALYADPSILIFDEATSALDTGVESAIMKTIFALPQSMTTIIIAHRLSTVERCDALFWIDDGRLIASGHPDELLSRYRAYLDAGKEDMTTHLKQAMQ